ncbi:peptidase T [Butyricimonas hominis]|uniref:peptidase T n=1 Tax=Butyricimonas TaxID=574697 RepID=UPI0025C74004|nr:peptidase T [Butyricimonas sp.]
MLPVVERFLRYAKIHTESDRETGLIPSTPGQLEFAYLLSEEMQAMGMQDVSVDDYGYVMGFVPGNTDKECSSIGFIAHMDTSPDMTGKHVKPQIIENYKGTDVLLNKEKGFTLSPDDFPELKNYVGTDLIVTDGNTLLGADDKAGIAEILTAMEYLIQHPEIKHGRIAVCFTPDEEIGEGVDHFDLKKFGAKFAYTLDGGEIGELEYENFNAALARLTFKGRNFHPGYAKNKMVNSIKVANEFMASLPKKEAPEYTSGYEGFFHIYSIKGTVEETVLEILIRDFDRETFEWRKGVIENGVREFTRKYDLPVLLDMKDQYANMKERLEPVRYIVDIAKQAMVELGIKPLFVPIRGGTNGSKLSFMGLPTPNLSNGAHNSHGRYEYIPVSSMENAVKLIVKISEFCAKV